MIVADTAADYRTSIAAHPEAVPTEELIRMTVQCNHASARKALAWLKDRTHSMSPGKADTDEFGFSETQARRFCALVEIIKRCYVSAPALKTVVDDPSVAASAVMMELGWAPVEKFAVLFLDIKHAIVGKKIISSGTATETLAHPREIFGAAMRAGASRVVVAHNHPSGSLDPSSDDLALTKRLLECAKFMDMPVLDHLIIGNGEYVSLRQTTALWA